jgi:hypothetical protein
LLIGPKTAALLAAELSVTLQGEPQPDAAISLTHNGVQAATQGQTRAVQLGPQAKPYGELRASADPNSPPRPAASITALGRGQIAATYFTFGQGYLSTGSQSARQFLNGLVRQLFPKPLVQVEGSSDVDVSVNRSGGRLAVNLVNTAGPHADRKTPVFETIPLVGPLEITIRLAKAPEHVTVEPGGQPLTFEPRIGRPTSLAWEWRTKNVAPTGDQLRKPIPLWRRRPGRECTEMLVNVIARERFFIGRPQVISIGRRDRKEAG